MELTTPSPRPETVVVYEFEFLGHTKPLQVDVWPKQGDTAESTDVGGIRCYVFDFPRLHLREFVYLTHLIRSSKSEQERLYTDAKELTRKVIDERIAEIAKRRKSEGSTSE